MQWGVKWGDGRCSLAPQNARGALGTAAAAAADRSSKSLLIDRPTNYQDSGGVPLSTRCSCRPSARQWDWCGYWYLPLAPLTSAHHCLLPNTLDAFSVTWHRYEITSRLVAAFTRHCKSKLHATVWSFTTQDGIHKLQTFPDGRGFNKVLPKESF